MLIRSNSASNVPEMTMLISLVVTLIQIRMGVGSVTFYNMGPCGIHMFS